MTTEPCLPLGWQFRCAPLPPVKVTLGAMQTHAIWIRPLNLEKLVERVLVELEGNAIIVLEGQLHQLLLPQDQHCMVPATFKREAPDAVGCIALRLGPGMGRRIVEAFRQSADWVELVEAIQIFVKGHLAFLAGDSFHHECISVRSSAPEGLIARLIADHLATLL